MITSIHAKALEECGFVRIGEPVPAELSEEMPMTFSQCQHPKISITLVTDEVHQCWYKKGIEDLSDLGFFKIEVAVAVTDFEAIESDDHTVH